MKVIALFNTKKKKIVAGATVFMVCGCVYLFNRDSGSLILATDDIKAELGQKVSIDVTDYLDYDKISKDVLNDVVKNTKEKDNLKYVTVTNKDENGNIISKEEKDYPKVGDYQITFTYKDEKKTVKVIVKDTTKPEIDAPESFDILQYTDLSQFNFSELFQVTDYSDVKDWKIDTSKVDVNTIGSYELKASIKDKYKNKATKKITVNVVESLQLAEGEVAVTEIVTDENGHKKTVISKKSASAVTTNDAVSTGKPVTNKDEVAKSSNTSSVKPIESSGTTGSTVKPTSSVHTHNWVAVTKTIHHDAVTKTVHHDAVTKQQTVAVVDQEAYDEPIYEGGYYICNKCEFYSKDGDEVMNHCIDVCNARYHTGKIQVGSKHHDAITHQETKTVVVTPAYDETVTVKDAYDETVITGYKCSCGATKSK